MVSNAIYLTDRAADVHAFLGSHLVATCAKQLDQTLERLDMNTAFIERNRDAIVDALR
jgi:hypothetical protein